METDQRPQYKARPPRAPGCGVPALVRGAEHLKPGVFPAPDKRGNVTSTRFETSRRGERVRSPQNLTHGSHAPPPPSDISDVWSCFIEPHGIQIILSESGEEPWDPAQRIRNRTIQSTLSGSVTFASVALSSVVRTISCSLPSESEPG